MIYPIAKGHAKDEYLSAFVISRLFPRNDNFSVAEYRDYRVLIAIAPIFSLFIWLAFVVLCHYVAIG